MEYYWLQLLHFALQNEATDIHFSRCGSALKIELRIKGELCTIKQDIFPAELLEYLKFKAGLDLCSPNLAQSGEFQSEICHQKTSLRFALLPGAEVTSGVVRILHTYRPITMEMCTASKTAREYFRKLTSLEHGLIISCGPTGSGKTTTIHALLSMIVQNGKRKIVSLEDPVEIHSPHFLQIPVTAALSYEAGIEQLMRHDPDVIFIGECRSSYTARMAVRAALTGCLVFTTLHAGSGKECLHRLVELGAARDDLACVLKGVFSQRLIVSQSETGKECIYELWDENTLENLFENESGANPLCTMEQCKADAGK